MTQIETIKNDSEWGGKSFAEAFNEITTGSSEVPPGTYNGIITAVKWKVGEYGESVNWEFTILDGDHSKRKVWLSDKIKPKTLFLLKNHMVELGYTGSIKDQSHCEEFLNSCVGRTCGLEVSYREYSFTNEAGNKVEGKTTQGKFVLDKTKTETDIPF